MIFVEALAREVNIPDARRVAGLEAITGSDLMVSRLSIPATNRTLITRHIQAGALLTQVKFGEDIASSIGDRLNESLARMVENHARQCQCVLLFVGILTADASGKALINGRKTHLEHDYHAVKRAMSKWVLRGGVVHELSREGLLEQWCKDQERLLNDCFEHSVKHVYQLGDYPDSPPVNDDPLQLPLRVTDGRRLLINLPGLGIELVERVWAYAGDTKSCLRFLTDTRSAGQVEGIGSGKIAKIRAYIGLAADDGPLESYEIEGVK